jgi:hypothetical protein
VGRVANAAEGSVSLTLAAPSASPDAEWFNQTQCGAFAWRLLRGFAVGGRLYP